MLTVFPFYLPLTLIKMSFSLLCFSLFIITSLVSIVISCLQLRTKVTTNIFFLLDHQKWLILFTGFTVLFAVLSDEISTFITVLWALLLGWDIFFYYYRKRDIVNMDATEVDIFFYYIQDGEYEHYKKTYPNNSWSRLELNALQEINQIAENNILNVPYAFQIEGKDKKYFLPQCELDNNNQVVVKEEYSENFPEMSVAFGTDDVFLSDLYED